MEDINFVESVPEYITTFITNNEQNIINIIEDEKKKEAMVLFI